MRVRSPKKKVPESSGATASADPPWLVDVVATLPPLATTEEAGEALRASRRTIGRWVATGQLHGVRVSDDGSGKILIPRTEVAEFLRRRLAAA